VNYDDPSGLVKRELDSKVDGRDGNFEVNWKFELDRPYPFDVYIVQKINIKIWELYKLPDIPFSDGGGTSFTEVVGLVKAGETKPIGVVDTWKWPGEASSKGKVEIFAQVRAFKASDIEETIKGWKENRSYPMANVTAWSAGGFKSNQAAPFFRKNVLEYEKSGANDGMTRATIVWPNNAGNNEITTETVKASPGWFPH